MASPRHVNAVRMDAMPWTGPLFIVGLPRSGTKLIRSLLNAHPQVGIPNVETQMLPYWVRHWNSYGDLSDRRVFHRFYERAAQLPYFMYQRWHGTRLIEEVTWHRLCRDFTPAGVFEALLRHDTQVRYDSPGIWGDKCPAYILHVPLLKQLFPEARFLHMVRDARDYCLSLRNAWGKHMLRSAQRWVDRIETARTAARTIGTDFRDLRYEDLLQAPERELRGLCDWLGIEYLPAMLVASASTENIGAAKGARTVLSDNREKFKREMDPDTQARIERIAGDVLKTYGYPTSYQGPVRRLSRLELLPLVVRDGFNLVRAEARRRGAVTGFAFVWKLVRTSANTRR